MKRQEALIKQLQEQHYEQYMSQVYAQQAQAQAASLEAARQKPSDSGSSDDSEAGPKPADAYLQQGLERPPPRDRVRTADESADSDEDDVSDEDGGADTDVPANTKIAPASLWTSKNIQEFKETIRKEGSEGIIKVGHGETVTVRVPTHEEGNSLFWEFSTDYYDIGFGVYFEWTVAESNQVTIHISESDDEDYEEEVPEGTPAAGAAPGDVEGGGPVQRKRDPNKPPMDEIIPVYRRDSHQEVFAGSHVYPGQGVYLLKFDNSYSLWRSKTLYYRVFYSK
ncbi:Protein Y41E3.7 c [Aphelenchoides avenae]|nr:Protein Y41E3.7 c [Aphelenchus avenae]